MTGGIRHEVVELLMDAAARSDLSVWPWRNLVHQDGRPFTAAEAELANSATMKEAVTAHALAIEGFKFYRRKHDDLGRARELLAPYAGTDPEEDISEIAARLPEPERSEVAEILARWPPEDAV